MRRIKLMADYQCWPLWEMDEPGGNIEPATLSISTALRSRLLGWAKRYDETLNSDAPSESGFHSSSDAEEFEAEAIDILLALRSELGDEFEVSYYSWLLGRFLLENEIMGGS